HHHPRDVEWPRTGVAPNVPRPEALRAPRAQLGQGQRVVQASSNVADPRHVRRRRSHLASEKPREIRGVERISNLPALTVEARISQRDALAPPMDPVREYALLGGAKLPRASEHTTTVDPHREREGRAILESQPLRRELGASVERDGRGGAELLTHALGVRPGREVTVGVNHEAVALLTQWEPDQSGNGIDPTRAQQNQAGADSATVFEHIESA